MSKFEQYLQEAGGDTQMKLIRKLIGPGKSSDARGAYTMFFPRGKEAWEKAFSNLKKHFELKKKQDHDSYYAFQTPDDDWFKLLKFDGGEDTNNFVIYRKMGHGSYK
jgi:hypothetical protein